MDPLSITASTISLLQASSKFSTLFLSKNRSAIPDLEDIIGDLPVYNDILREMSEMIPSFYGTLPLAANSALLLCERRMKKIFALMSKEDESTWKGRGDKVRLSDLERAADRYRQSVSLLREVVMDSITHQLLRDQQTDLGRRLAGTVRPPAKQITQTGEDPTTFDASIMGVKGHIVGRGLLDSGCDDNWITLDVVKRAGLESLMQKEAYNRTFVGFGGHGVKPIGKIDITWFANNSPKTRRTACYVAKDGPFDVLLGKHFIFGESIFRFDSEALVLKFPKLTEGKSESFLEHSLKFTRVELVVPLTPLRILPLISSLEEQKQQEENERLAEEREKQDAITRAQKEEEARNRARQHKEEVSKSQDASMTTLSTSSAASSVRSSRSPARHFIR